VAGDSWRGWLLGGAFGFLPVLTVPLFGLASNPLVYIAAVGVIDHRTERYLAKGAVWLACAIFALLMAEVLIGDASIAVSAPCAWRDAGAADWRHRAQRDS